MEHPFSVSKGITIMPPVIGRITAGHTVVRGDKAFPVRAGLGTSRVDPFLG
jgi:hypothetical protein